MNNWWIKISVLGFIVLITVLLNLINRINIKSVKAKQTYLSVNRVISISKQSYMYSLRAIIYITISIISLVVIIGTFKVDIRTLLFMDGQNILKAIISLVLGIFVSMKMFFITSILFISFILKKDLTGCITKVKWIDKSEEYAFYTKIIRPCAIAIFEVILYCVIFNNILLLNTDINFVVSALIVSVIYGFGKSLLVCDLELKVLMFSYGFWSLFTANLVYGFTGNALYSICLFIVTISFWVFKR
ncbi:hypothetical protein J1C67_11085 [Clostridium gasigenes]|uniref:SagF family protein n=1 Tax=Clostridium gasigenes TaxID=94869 RepID=UPI0014384581|nr:hypothetical protein [Clostridium gasigenes]NKF07128.1 hypothetical protein [Clostridium gasigenes]QSW18111.1 hypothetical protein J1C67_11085 [Clostridium gasigenes]